MAHLIIVKYPTEIMLWNASDNKTK